MENKTFTAKDIMTRDVVCVRTGTNLRELEKIFLEKGISGAPVIDDSGNLVGVISLKDLVYYHLTEGIDLNLKQLRKTGVGRKIS